VSAGAVKSSIPAVNCAIASFSPKGTYILTWERLTDDLQNKGGNLRVSQAATGEFVGGFVQKSFSKEAWPYVKWSSDEMIASMKITDGVHLFAGNDIAKGVIGKVPHEKMTSFGMAPGPAPYKFATFSPEKGDKPAQIKTWVYPNLKEAVGNKTMFRASDAEIKWSPNGQAGLVKTTTDVDATGKSYYGESKLAFVSVPSNQQTNPFFIFRFHPSVHPAIHPQLFDGSRYKECLARFGWMVLLLWRVEDRDRKRRLAAG
jgi:translation initiation factor 2A